MDGGYFSYDRTRDPPSSHWKHIVLTHASNGETNMYINGVPQPSASANTANITFSDPNDETDYCYFCFMYTQQPGTFNLERFPAQSIDDFYLITRALTPSEAMSMYQDSRRWNLADPAVKIYYDFDEEPVANDTRMARAANLGYSMIPNSSHSTSP